MVATAAATYTSQAGASDHEHDADGQPGDGLDAVPKRQRPISTHSFEH